MILRPCVVIPCYDNPATIADVARRALASCPFPLLIVDDGSLRPVAELLRAEGVRDRRLEVHRFPENRGKGLALRFALKRCLERGFTHMITLDGDGQHFPEDLPLFAEEIRAKPFHLVIGHRRMDESAPGISHFGRAFSNFWVRYQADEAGSAVKDSQSGFRAYPLFPLQTMRFLTRRYDFEIEVLVRALWRGVEVSNVPIRVLYQPGAARVSHFHKLRDNARISALNTLLVGISLCRRGLEPLPAALAFGLGVFVGCTPFFGLHTPIVVALALILRLNALVLWAGSQISIPPLAPFLAMASIFLGSRLLGQPLPLPGQGEILELAKNSFLAWLAGSLALGAVLGTISGAFVFALARSRKSRASARQRNWTGETRGGRFGNGFLILVLRRLGLRAGYFCLHFVVPYFYLFAPKARRGLDEYWRVVKPGLGWLGRQRRIYLHLLAFARVIMDRAYQLHSGRPVFERKSSGFGPVREALEAKKGILLAGAHAGSFDLAATSFQAHGLGRKLHVIQHEAQRLTMAKATGEKSRELVDIIYVGESEPAIFRARQALENGEMLGLLADRPLDHKFELVPFFGRLAPIATSPFQIALATGAELAFTYGFKGKGLAYEFSCVRPEPPQGVAAADRELAAYHYAAEYARALEQKLRTHPEQWFNLYGFFSSRPTLPNGELCTPRSCRLEPRA